MQSRRSAIPASTVPAPTSRPAAVGGCRYTSLFLAQRGISDCGYVVDALIDNGCTPLRCDLRSDERALWVAWRWCAPNARRSVMFFAIRGIPGGFPLKLVLPPCYFLDSVVEVLPMMGAFVSLAPALGDFCKYVASVSRMRLGCRDRDSSLWVRDVIRELLCSICDRSVTPS